MRLVADRENRSSAVDRPIPEEPPVMRTTLSLTLVRDDVSTTNVDGIFLLWPGGFVTGREVGYWKVDPGRWDDDCAHWHKCMQQFPYVRSPRLGVCGGVQIYEYVRGGPWSAGISTYAGEHRLIRIFMTIATSYLGYFPVFILVLVSI